MVSEIKKYRYFCHHGNGYTIHPFKTLIVHLKMRTSRKYPLSTCLRFSLRHLVYICDDVFVMHLIPASALSAECSDATTRPTASAENLNPLRPRINYRYVTIKLTHARCTI